jgi:hypothetical protein
MGVTFAGNAKERMNVSDQSRRPDIAELVGSALNASSLEFAENHERPLDRVAAVGAAARRIETGADLAGLPIAAMDVDVYRRSADMRRLMLDPGTVDPRDVIAGRLCPLLLHVREGGQSENLREAIGLFADWMRHRRPFDGFAGESQHQLLVRFAERVMLEWDRGLCPRCSGSGKLERTRGGAWIHPRGSMQRNATFRECTGCSGSGRARPSHGGRARWLEMPMERYESERWEQRFTAAHSWLTRILRSRMLRPLTAELERRKRHI